MSSNRIGDVVLPEAMPLRLIAVWYAAAELLICSPRSQLDLRESLLREGE